MQHPLPTDIAQPSALLPDQEERRDGMSPTQIAWCSQKWESFATLHKAVSANQEELAAARAEAEREVAARKAKKESKTGSD